MNVLLKLIKPILINIIEVLLKTYNALKSRIKRSLIISNVLLVHKVVLLGYSILSLYYYNYQNVIK